MLNLRFDFGSIGRLFGVPRKFLSQVGAFCVSFSSGHQIIDVRVPAFPEPNADPVTVGINEDVLKSFIEEALDLSSYLTSADVGVEDGVAAYDHTHSTSDLTDWTTATAGFLTSSDISGFIDSGDIGSTVQAYSAKLTALAGELDQSGRVPLTMLTGNIDGHSGDCFVTIDNGGSLGHSGNKAFNMLIGACYDGGNERTNYKLITDADIGNGLEADSTTHNLKVKVATNGGIGFNSQTGGLKLDSLGSGNANGLLMTDASGNIIVGTEGKSLSSCDFVTNVSWNGTTLSLTKRTMTFTNGVLTTVGNASSATIDTPTKIAWN